MEVSTESPATDAAGKKWIAIWLHPPGLKEVAQFSRLARRAEQYAIALPI